MRDEAKMLDDLEPIARRARLRARERRVIVERTPEADADRDAEQFAKAFREALAELTKFADGLKAAKNSK